MTKLTFQKNDIGLGKRKQAVARVFLVPGEGNIIINKKIGQGGVEASINRNNELNTTFYELKFLDFNSGYNQKLYEDINDVPNPVSIISKSELDNLNLEERVLLHTGYDVIDDALRFHVTELDNNTYRVIVIRFYFTVCSRQ